MALNKKTGSITMLGNASINKGRSVYSLIEMGDGSILKSVVVGSTIDNFLGRALHSHSEITMWMDGRQLRAVSIEGKTYVDSSGYQSPILSYIFIAIGIPLCFFLVGFFIVFANIWGLKTANSINEVLAANPDAIRL